MIEIKDIKREYAKSAQVWGINQRLPLGTVPMEDGRAHLECLPDGRMAFVTTERGMETSRKETAELGEIMYWIFEQPAYARAWEYEKVHRNPHADSRRIVFPIALDEIGRLSLKWRDRMAAEQLVILRESPFYDIQ